MEKKHDKPWWYGNFPAFEGKKKKPVKISKDMEVVTSYKFPEIILNITEKNGIS
jgi:hypothetical protein